MGFRSMFCTEDFPYQWPDWFREKYQKTIHVPEKGPLSSKRECKFYSAWSELEEDIQKAVDWGQYDHLVMVYLHECGGITRVEITKSAIRFTEPTGWRKGTDVTHSYCYGCSNAENAE